MNTKIKSPHFVSTFPLSYLIIKGVKVCYEENATQIQQHFKKEKRSVSNFQKMLEEAQMNPKAAYPTVLEWKKEDPDNPIIDNLLTYLHLKHKQVGKAEDLIYESYQKHPTYFFAKINYADQCLRKKNLKEIPIIFPSFNLKKLFPSKESFHVSEYRGFMTLIGQYYLAIKDISSAKECYANAYEADPTHPSVVLLEKKIYKKDFFSKLLQKIIDLARIS